MVILSCDNKIIFIMFRIINNYNYTEKPTLPALLKYPPCCSSHQCINIAARIGDKYWKFGIFLLDDKHGDVVDAIVHSMYQQDTEQINVKIFQKWLNGMGLQPVSWETLVQVLKDIGFNELAKELEFYRQSNNLCA